ncbi:single-stranded DNA-binding protein [Weissella soli]|jgi:single-strand DNA-binding protein|uniref:Single-stranded DNA-binding protein n=1 Tax=Weissella soli TaxID=155866 RepID=A0A288Q5Y9_9LACO|nr:single-stranded DNA-binding protein [Weissella soli]AOT55845.1 Single-stranded DNA-binding protein [Weissella soli]NKY83657.1 single-stranded DNA-binding protein [Weissella soli]RDL06481.1 single-strand binding protein [Weissella soli]GEN93466.1 single-stranded DNA-binding protein [Weissella soli]
MINRVVLVGRLTRDVELRYTTSGAAVGTFSLAVNRQFTNASGEREADFINAVIWRKSAENFAQFTSKGSLVAVEGRLQTRNYENQQGQRIYVTEVVVDNFSLLESRAESESRRSSQGATQTNNNGFGGNNGGGFNAQPSSNPFGSAEPSNGNVFGGAQSSAAPKNDPFAGQGQEVSLSDDDLPF